MQPSSDGDKTKELQKELNSYSNKLELFNEVRTPIFDHLQSYNFEPREVEEQLVKLVSSVEKFKGHISGRPGKIIDNSIKSTFINLAPHFSDILPKFVEGGGGSLVM